MDRQKQNKTKPNKLLISSMEEALFLTKDSLISIRKCIETIRFQLILLQASIWLSSAGGLGLILH